MYQKDGDDDQKEDGLRRKMIRRMVMMLRRKVMMIRRKMYQKDGDDVSEGW